MRTTLALLIGMIAAFSAGGASAETLKVAVAQRGFWNSSFIEFALQHDENLRTSWPLPASTAGGSAAASTTSST